MEQFKLLSQKLIKIGSKVKSYLVDGYEGWLSLLSYCFKNFDGQQ